MSVKLIVRFSVATALPMGCTSATPPVFQYVDMEEYFREFVKKISVVEASLRPLSFGGKPPPFLKRLDLTAGRTLHVLDRRTVT